MPKQRAAAVQNSDYYKEQRVKQRKRMCEGKAERTIHSMLTHRDGLIFAKIYSDAWYIDKCLIN